MKAIAAALVVVCALLAAGCGGGGGGTSPDAAAGAACAKHGGKQALAKVQRDLAAIRRAANTVRPGHTFNGNDAVNEATDRFLLDVAKPSISNLQKNRLIDHAMSALVGSCEQCFQALEANRPIPAIKFPHGNCGH